VIPALEGETNPPQVVTYTAANGIGYQNIITAMSKITAGYFNGSSIYATSATIWTLLAGIVDNVKQPIFIPDVTASGVGRMFGLPVKAEDGVTAGKVVIGNFAKGYASNMNADVEIHYEEHVLARKTDYAAWTLADGKPMTTKAFAELKAST
jgi:HK97 family phage major capsid protein